MGRFQNVVSQKVKHLWSDEGLEQMWKAIKVALCEAAETVLERESKRQPDWFRESEVSLIPVLEKRNTLYKKWIRTGVESDKIKYKRARREARLMTREAKNRWFQQKAAEAQKGRNGGKVVWRCIRDIQRGRRGLIPLKTTQVNDEDGNICSTPQQQQERWRRHFSKVLNIVSQFDEEELREVRQRPLRSHMAEPPTVEELEEAISKLKSGKAAGQSGILPEMIRAASYDDDFLNSLLELVQLVWREGKVPQDWIDAILVPIPKKGDLKNCDNWRGISLLDVVGKVVARILQERLQELAEEELPESQCGFRKSRSCTDMIFVV